MKKVYIVFEIIDNEHIIGGVYSTYTKAHQHAVDIANYAGATYKDKDFWAYGDNDGIAITEHEVL